MPERRSRAEGVVLPRDGRPRTAAPGRPALRAVPEAAGRSGGCGCGPFRGPSKGVVAVELALVLPFLVLVLTALFDLGLAAYEAMLVEAAAAAGAHYAELYPWDASAIAAIVAGATGSGGITANPAPSEFCACPDTGSLAAVDCGASCPDGSRPSVYGEVSAELTHFTALHYPALPQPLVLTGEAIVRLK